MATSTTTSIARYENPVNPDGTMLGQSITDLVGFHGVTGTAQRAAAAQAAVVTTAVTQTTPFGFATGAQGDALIALVNEMRLALVNKGIIKGAA